MSMGRFGCARHTRRDLNGADVTTPVFDAGRVVVTSIDTRRTGNAAQVWCWLLSRGGRRG
jgi:hypothetical protein